MTRTPGHRDRTVDSTDLQEVRRRPPVGAGVLVVGVVQFFVCHLIVESQWATPYSWADNNLSDLGNVHCGPWGPDDRYVCSPWHDLMNVSFVALGVALVIGLLLVRRSLGIARTATALVAAGAAGFVVAGLVPADVDEDTHVLLGAVPIFLGGNGGLILIGLSRRFTATSAALRAATLTAGVVGLGAVVLFLSGTYAGLGMGGMERVAALMMPVWLVTVALLGAAVPRARTT